MSDPTEEMSEAVIALGEAYLGDGVVAIHSLFDDVEEVTVLASTDPDNEQRMVAHALLLDEELLARLQPVANSVAYRFNVDGKR